MSTPLALPIISISPYLPSRRNEYTDTDRAEVAQKLHRACTDIGFFYLKVDDYLTDSERKEVLDFGRQFFLESTEEEKAEIGLEKGDGIRGEFTFGVDWGAYVGLIPACYLGYQKLKQNVTMGKADHHEGLDFYAETPYPPGESRYDSGQLKPLG